MLPKITKEIGVGILLLLILSICYYGFLPESMKMITHTALIIAFGIVAVLIWHEKSADEREQTHKLIATQVAFIAGGLVLVTTIVYGGLTGGQVHPSVYSAFGAMILGKVLGRLWANRYL